MAAGLFGLRQELGKLAMAGSTLIMLQVLCCPITGFGLEGVVEEAFYVLVYTPAILGFTACAVAALPTGGASMRPLRFVILGLSAIAVLGVLLTMLGVLLTSDAIDMRIDDPFQPMQRYTRMAGAYALVAFTVLVALLARRRPDDPTEPGEHPQPPLEPRSEASVHDASQPAITSS